MLNPLTIEFGIMLAILFTPLYLFGLIGTIYELKEEHKNKNKDKRRKNK